MGVRGVAGFTVIFSFFFSSPGERSMVVSSPPSLVVVPSSQHLEISLSSIVSKCSVLANVICNNTDGHRRGPLINVGSPSSSSSTTAVLLVVDAILLLVVEYVSSS